MQKRHLPLGYHQMNHIMSYNCGKLLQKVRPYSSCGLSFVYYAPGLTWVFDKTYLFVHHGNVIMWLLLYTEVLTTSAITTCLWMR